MTYNCVLPDGNVCMIDSDDVENEEDLLKKVCKIHGLKDYMCKLYKNKCLDDFNIQDHDLADDVVVDASPFGRLISEESEIDHETLREYPVYSMQAVIDKTAILRSYVSTTLYREAICIYIDYCKCNNISLCPLSSMMEDSFTLEILKKINNPMNPMKLSLGKNRCIADWASEFVNLDFDIYSVEEISMFLDRYPSRADEVDPNIPELADSVSSYKVAEIFIANGLNPENVSPPSYVYGDCHATIIFAKWKGLYIEILCPSCGNPTHDCSCYFERNENLFDYYDV